MAPDAPAAAPAAVPAAVPAAASEVAHHFQDRETQRNAAHLGMWVFLVSEILLFGGLFTLYGSVRLQHPVAFARAAGHTSLWIMTAGTVVLLAASFLVAWAVHSIRLDHARAAAALFWGAAALATAFLGLKAWEYTIHAADGILPGAWYRFEELLGPGAAAFFNLYYVMTGLHALHVAVGVGLLAWIAWRARRLHFGARYHTPLELSGMYWHLVDLVWLFLWPFFYLMR